ncbi:hypothetical protein ARMSODRAFT_958074 [Armillaria solidipes]|uniref:Uncharacterized protein n=1 Tax=Armillaria solidipes TaxID=1076256 RepID=A0A2H3BYH8_9AGAR|nr:hypothetical protein ARMSODRAFT_958074 [Armillaria solidipes]
MKLLPALDTIRSKWRKRRRRVLLRLTRLGRENGFREFAVRFALASVIFAQLLSDVATSCTSAILLGRGQFPTATTAEERDRPSMRWR